MKSVILHHSFPLFEPYMHNSNVNLQSKWHVNGTSRTFLGEILDWLLIFSKLHRITSKKCFLGGGAEGGECCVKSLTDWHVDSEENDKSAVAEHCALRWEREEPRESVRRVDGDQACSLYLLNPVISCADLRFRYALTHIIPETIVALVSIIYLIGQHIIRARRCCSPQRPLYRPFPASELSGSSACRRLCISRSSSSVALAFSGRAYRFAWWRSSIVSRPSLLRAEHR